MTGSFTPQAREALLGMKRRMSWREIASLDQFRGVEMMTLWRFARLGIVPKKRRDRVLLGLVQRRPRKPKLCPKCGAAIN